MIKLKVTRKVGKSTSLQDWLSDKRRIGRLMEGIRRFIQEEKEEKLDFFNVSTFQGRT